MPLTLEDIIAGIQPLDQAALEKAREHTARLVMPPRALGRLHEIGERLCGIQGTLTPAIAPEGRAGDGRRPRGRGGRASARFPSRSPAP